MQEFALWLTSVQDCLLALVPNSLQHESSDALSLPNCSILHILLLILFCSSIPPTLHIFLSTSFTFPLNKVPEKPKNHDSVNFAIDFNILIAHILILI